MPTHGATSGAARPERCRRDRRFPPPSPAHRDPGLTSSPAAPGPRPCGPPGAAPLPATPRGLRVLPYARRWCGAPARGSGDHPFPPLATASGNAVADLFRTWCRLRGDKPEGEVDRIELTTVVSEMFQDLGLDVAGPASQVDQTASQHVYTVFGLSCDHSDDLHVAAVIPGEHAQAVIESAHDEGHFGRWASTFTAAPADTAADMARRQVENGDTEGLYDRLTVPTEITCGYPEYMLEALQDALNNWLHDHPEHDRPLLVEFDVTHTYPEGAAWSEWGPTFHYASDPEHEERNDFPVERVMSGVGFTGTAVADALVELDDWERPINGETLFRPARPPPAGLLRSGRGDGWSTPSGRHPLEHRFQVLRTLGEEQRAQTHPRPAPPPTAAAQPALPLVRPRDHRRAVRQRRGDRLEREPGSIQES